MIPQKLNRSEAAVLNDGKLTLRFYEFLNGLASRLISSSTFSPYYSSSELTFADSPYTVTSISETLFVDATGGSVTINLLPAALGNYCNVIKEDSSANTVTLYSADGIIGSTTQVLSSQWDSIECICSSVGYRIR